MNEFRTEIEISAPPARVFQVMSDVERWHEWTPSIASIKRLGSGPFAVGTRVLVRQPKFPAALWKVSAIEPGKSFTWVSTAPGMHVVGRHAVESTATGSRATLTLSYYGILGRIFARLTKGITERYIGFEARGLKARSENPDFRHTGFP
jgi:uncharacterized protein YndB with AHSA1/START domain